MNKMLSDRDLAASGLSAKKLELLLWGIIFVYFCLILTLSLSYHWGYLSTLADVGTFDQAVWGTLNGASFLNTNGFSSPINYFGIHFRPILTIFLPFYALLPLVEWMIIAQSVALAITAWPIYLLASRIFEVKSGAFFMALAYLANPFVLSVPPWVFRPESIAVPFIALSMLGMEKGDLQLTLLSCFVIMLCKEHFGIMVSGFGILWLLRNRDLQGAIILFLFGLFYSFLVLTVIMPWLSPIGKHVMLGSGMGQFSRYSWLGGGFGEMAQNILFHPLAIGKTIIGMGGDFYLLLLLIFFLGLPLAGIEFLLPGLADLSANLLSANPMPRGVFYYHSVSLMPVISVAAIYGAKRISQWIGRYSTKDLASLTLIASLIGGYLLAPLPLPGARNYWDPVNPLSFPDPVVLLIRQMVGEGASVSAQANVGAHFSQRKEIFQYPDKIDEVDAIILRLMSPTRNVDQDFNYPAEHQKTILGTIDGHLQMNRDEYISSIEYLLESHKYGVLLWQDPWLVLSRNGDCNKSLSEIKSKIGELRTEWKIGLVEKTHKDMQADLK